MSREEEAYTRSVLKLAAARVCVALGVKRLGPSTQAVSTDSSRMSAATLAENEAASIGGEAILQCISDVIYNYIFRLAEDSKEVPEYTGRMQTGVMDVLPVLKDAVC